MKFPTYQSQAAISTQIAKPQDFSVDYSPIVKAGAELAQQWQKATDVTETNQAYNNVEQGSADIIQRASAETDYKNKQRYLDEVEKLRTSQGDTFSNTNTANKFQRVADSSANQTAVKINGLFRNKMIKHQQGEVVRSQALNKSAYMGGDMFSKDINQGILKENFDNGFISEDMYQKGLMDMDNWEYERAQQDVATNPDFVLRNLDSYEIDEKQKAEVRKDAESLTKRNNEIQLIEKLELEELSTTQLMDLVNSDATDTEKTQAIQTQVLLGNVSQNFASKLNKLMVSEKAVNAVTKDKVMSDIILRTYDLNAAADRSPKDYLTGIQNIKDEIITRQSTGELSQEDANSLNRQLKTLTSGKTAESTSFISDTFGDVTETFEQQLPPEYRGKAVRELFYAIEGRELTESEYKNEALKVIDNINRARRDFAIKKINEPFNLDEQRDFLSERGYTIQDVRDTAQKYGLTEQQVISRMKGTQ